MSPLEFEITRVDCIYKNATTAPCFNENLRILLYTDYKGSQAFTKNWVGPFLVKNYGMDVARKIVPHGVIVMDTIMNYNATEKSQTIPQHHSVKVSHLL